MSDAPPVTLTPSDRVGIVKQGLEEIQRYLFNTPVLEVSGPVCQAHMERLGSIIGVLIPVEQPPAERQSRAG